MKKGSVILLLLFLGFGANGTFAQSPDFRELWRQYEQMDHSFTVDALKHLDLIADYARAANDDAQLFRTRCERFKIHTRYGVVWTPAEQLLYLDSLRKTASQPYQGMYNYLICKVLLSLKTNSRVIEPSGWTDFSRFSEWGLRDIREAAVHHFEQAVTQLLEAGDFSTEPFEFLLVSAADSLRWQPVLLDMVLQDFFHYSVDTLFVPSLNLLLPKVVQMHTSAHRRTAAIHYELSLLDLRHASQTTWHNALDSHPYWLALTRLEQQYGRDIAILYQKAAFLYFHKYDYPESYPFCERLLREVSEMSEAKTLYAQNARCLLNRLTEPVAKLEEQQVNRLPQNKIDFPILYKNVDTLYLSVYKTDTIFYKYGSRFDLPVSPFSSSFLPHFNNCVQRNRYVLHPSLGIASSTEVWIDSLPFGNYTVALHTSFEPDSDNCLSVFPLKVTDVQWTQIERTGKVQLFASDAFTGEPLVHKKVSLTFDHWAGHLRLKRKTDRYGQISFRKNTLKRRFIITKDPPGIPRRWLKNWAFRDSVSVDVSLRQSDHTSCTRANIHLNRPYNYHNNYWYPSSRIYRRRGYDNIRTITDRSLYRPGQTVYFKTILNRNNGRPLRKGQVKVVLEDGLYKSEEYDTLMLTLSDFGSVSGQFRLPEKPGRYYLNIRKGRSLRYYSYEGIDVEEYKLPSFHIELQNSSEIVWHHDSVNVTGKAESYAGFPLSNVDVNLRVKVQNAKRQQVALYEQRLETAADGSFSFVFPISPSGAYADVEVVVTDQNGETHTKEKHLIINQRPLIINVQMPKEVNLWLSDTIEGFVTTYNNLDKPVNPPVRMMALRLRAPESVGIYHPMPAKPIYTLEEYRQHFPQYRFEISEGTNPEDWEVVDTVWQTVRTCYPNSVLCIDVRGWKTGYYKFLFQTTDTLVPAITEQQIVHVIHSGIQDVPFFAPIYLNILPTEAIVTKEELLLSVRKGNDKPRLFRTRNIPLVVSSSLNNPSVTLFLQTSRNPFDMKKLHIHNGLDTVYVRLRKTGYLHLRAFSCQNGQLYTASERFDVGEKLTKTQIRKLNIIPKSLNINVIHWNNRIEPGHEEEWEVEITDSEGRHPETEVLSWMIDKSLFGLDMSPISVETLREQSAPNRYGIRLSRSFFHGYHYSFHILNTSAKAVPTVPKQVRCSVAQEFSLQFEPFSGVYFVMDHTTSSSRLSGANVPAYTYKRVLLGSSDGVSSRDGEMTSVRGNRSDGQVTIVDGIRVRESQTTTEIADAIGEQSDEIPSPGYPYIRKNFTETAFFAPHLRTDAQGRVKMVFTIPDQLTEWQMALFGHTRKGLTVFNSLSATSCKSLMVQMNVPRYLREGDTMTIQTKIYNITDTVLEGSVRVEFFNPETNSPISMLLGDLSEQDFRCEAHGGAVAGWRIAVPQNISMVACRVVAQSGHFSDGEERVLPVITNRVALTESMRFIVSAGNDTVLIFSKLKDNQSATLQSCNYTVEVTTNPAWTAIQTLPYLMSYRYECNEQLFSKLFANALARHVMTEHPEIAEVYQLWLSDTSKQVFDSQLFKNENLKSVLLSETPWTMQARNESQRLRQAAELFQANRLDQEIEKISKKLINNQMQDGGFGWYGNHSFSPYITSHLVAGYYKLKMLGVELPDMDKSVQKAIHKLDRYYQKQYADFMADTTPDKRYYLSDMDIQYLYARTCCSVDTNWLAADYVNFLLYESTVFHLSLMQQAQMALTSYRIGLVFNAQRLMEIIRQQAVISPTEGMYWKKEFSGRYYAWYEAPIERQAILIEAFNIISPNKTELDLMKQWLLMQKNQKSWSNTKATAEAVFALMLGSPLQRERENSTVLQVGRERFTSAQEPTTVTGTGYFTRSWNGGEITPHLADVTVSADSGHFVFGACYWQYLEDVTKVSEASTGLQVQRALYHQVATPEGIRLEAVTAENPVRLGEKLTVRITITSDRDLEYVHLKDSRAAAFEPVNNHVDYIYRNPIPYTIVPHDAATDLFFDRVPKGTYIIEYPLLATQIGCFSNGLATVECMYAPEFRAQSAPLTIEVVR